MAAEEVFRAIHPRVAVVFDFDETLAPRTTDVLLEHLGVDPDEFEEEVVRPRVDDGWEERLAEAQGLVELSESGRPITAETFAEVAQALELYPGVEDMFDAVTDAVHEIEDDLDVEFHVITAGFVEVPEATGIADRFDSIIGGRWAFDDRGCILTPKSTVGHYDKVRHLLALAKGLPSIQSDRADDVNADIDETEWHVSFEQMVFVGDGDSDMPSFDLMESRGGVAIAVRQAEEESSWESRDSMRDGRQVVSLVESDFSEGSPLLTALCASAQRAALWVRALRTRG